MKKLESCEFEHVTPEEVGVDSKAITASVSYTHLTLPTILRV